MKRTELIPAMIAGLTLLLGGGIWAAVRRAKASPIGDIWFLLVLLFIAGISLSVFLAYAFVFADAATLAVI
jgi:hypothetical protein